MAFVGPGRYVVVVINVGGTKFSNVNLVLQREPRTGTTWFPAGYVAANEEPVDAAVRELHEETGLALTPDDLTLLSDAPVRVALLEGQPLVYIYSACIPVPFVTGLSSARQLLLCVKLMARYVGALTTVALMKLRVKMLTHFRVWTTHLTN
jgi:8-oxo-dGTP pyrophosphatase MutT (NUDIX family)